MSARLQSFSRNNQSPRISIILSIFPPTIINNGIAAAFYDPWKKNIDRINKGDIAFLYENGVGIIAYGSGSGETLKKDRYGDINECHYQILSDFIILQNPLSATKIKKILSRNIVFLRTMSGMPDGQKLLDFINSKLNI